MEIQSSSSFQLISKILEFFEDHNQKLIREDDNILSFLGDIEFLIRLNILPSKFQRQIDLKQVDEIVDYQTKIFKTKNKFEIFNCLFISYCNVLRDNYQIIDGQHRFTAFQKLFETNGNFKIEYKIIICQNEDQMYTYFEMINKSRPLVLHRNRNEGETMRKLITHIRTKYKSYVKPSENPRVPNMNLDKLERFLKEHHVVSKCIEKDLDVVEMLEKLNTFYNTILEQHSEKWHEWGVLQYQINLPDPKLFFGLYKNYEWISHLLRHIEEGIEYESFPHRSSICMERITKKLRKDLWRKYFGSEREGVCLCCDDVIDEDNYHAGHIISRVKGGETKMENLKPICPTCNRDMMIENMDDYKSRLDRQIK
jgi:hypothetical protein